MTQKSDFSDLLFPKRLILRFDRQRRKKNWHAYRSAVETLVRLRGLESHLQSVDRPANVELDEKERKKWEEDDKLCISIIFLNIKGELPWSLGRMYEEGRSAGALWAELRGRGHTSSFGGTQEDETFIKVLISGTMVGFLAIGLMIAIRSPTSAFAPPSSGP